MTSIVLTPEQAEIVKGSLNAIEIRGPQGEWLGILSNPAVTEEDVRLAKESQASTSQRFTMPEVLAHLQSLETQ